MGSDRIVETFSAATCDSAGEFRRARGRPAADHFLRRTEIYFRALPLLASQSGRDVRLDAAAKAVDMSLGGLRYYFPNRDDLLFFPLLPKTCDAMYTSLVRRGGHGSLPPDAFLGWFLESFADGAVASRTASRMAVEAGPQVVRLLLNQHPELDWAEVRDAITVMGGHSRAQNPEWLRRFLRREYLAATLDERATTGEIATDLQFALGVLH
jgi:AcrR family transcriptional regulator